MAANYSEQLRPYPNKGVCGLEEKFESAQQVALKASLLARRINEANFVVVYTGAGVSTAAGICDFRQAIVCCT